jgi:hypothetical protein
MFDGTNLLLFRKRKEWITQKVKKELEKQKRKTHTHTSTLESVSASLRLISLPIEKKTSSTFKFVFALCRTYSFGMSRTERLVFQMKTTS